MKLVTERFQIDTTHGLAYHNYPVHLLGFSNADRQFIPTILAVSYSEETTSFVAILDAIKQALDYSPSAILADGKTSSTYENRSNILGAKAITAAVTDVFPDAKRIMCWAHVLRNADKRLRQLKDKDLRARLRSDIVELQLARNEYEFNEGKQCAVNHDPQFNSNFSRPAYAR